MYSAHESNNNHGDDDAHYDISIVIIIDIILV